MKETYHFLVCMLSAKKHGSYNEYQWYKYLLYFNIKQFFKRFLPKEKDSLPF